MQLFFFHVLRMIYEVLLEGLLAGCGRFFGRDIRVCDSWHIGQDRGRFENPNM